MLYCQFQLSSMRAEPIVVSEATRARAEEVKKYIEKKYNLTHLQQEQRQQHWRLFEEKVKALNLSLEEKETARKNILAQEMNELRKRREKISRRNFESLCVIGRGAFGEVRLCRERKTGKMVAIKCLKKAEMVKKGQQAHLKAERDVLAEGGEWIVKLLYSFQDQNYLYLVMDYLGGGDLMNLLIARNVLPEDHARFYAAEILLAIESIHLKHYIHRDLKPDNVLLDSRGHVQLSDFGLCKLTPNAQPDSPPDYVPGKIAALDLQRFKEYLGRKGGRRELAFSAVGTPDYIAPEMLRREGYGEMVDWWALGVIIYEMLIGYAPFAADSNEQTYYKIEHHDQFLYFPPEAPLSLPVVDLISRLLAEPHHRLGSNGPAEIKAHPWFAGINWLDIRNQPAPFEPALESQTDTRYFDRYEESEPWIFQGPEESGRKDFNFIGYTYKMETEPSRNMVQEEMEKIEKARQEEKQQLRDMKKKKQPQQQDISYSKNLFQKLQAHQPTERNKPRKSKSPLAAKDTNKDHRDSHRLRTKHSTSRSPLRPPDSLRDNLTNRESTTARQAKESARQGKETGREGSREARSSGLPRKMAPLNLQGVSSMIYGSDLGRTLQTRRSVKKVK